jgi:hypothetical protein
VGYELHVTRAEQWYDSHQAPIELADWLGYAATNPLLVERGWVDWHDAGRVPVFAYVCRDGVEVSLTWHDDRIQIRGVQNNVGALELVKIADDLQASLIGDEGERYMTPGTAGPH